MPTTRYRVAGGASQATNVIKESLKRLSGLVEVSANAVGVKPFKQLRLRIVILRDEQGEPLCNAPDVQASWDEASRIFSLRSHIRIIGATPRVMVLPHPAPVKALDVHCDDGAWQEDMDETGDFFRQNCAKTASGKWLGYGAPVTVYIVRNISNKGGCSLGPLTDYVTLEAGMLDRARHRLLAHEVAHACGLWHSRDKGNLMYPKGPGDTLTWWQALVLRNSRHVTLV